MITRPGPRPWTALWIALLSGSCTTLALAGSARDDQLSAVLTDLKEGTRDTLVVLEQGIQPMAEAGGEDPSPEVVAAGTHSGRWLEDAEREGLVDRRCGRLSDPGCQPAAGVTVVRLSRPFEAGQGVFVDAEVRWVTASEFGTIRYRKGVRFRIDRSTSRWRVVSSTPLWETSG